MSQYLLLNRIRVQNANAVSGFTWGFPAVTHFLGFTHNLHRKLQKSQNYKQYSIRGCAVVAHEHHVHSYQTSNGINFSQLKATHYLESDNKGKLKENASIVEEARMNMTVSLLVGFDGYIGNQKSSFEKWLRNICFIQRLAGGTILEIESVDHLYLDAESDLRQLKKNLLPGFFLLDRSEYLARHFEDLQKNNPEAELLDAWLDFSILKKKARPKNDLIEKHLYRASQDSPNDEKKLLLCSCWERHKESPYQQASIPEDLITYFNSLDRNYQSNNKLLSQWKEYCEPTEKTDADWEYVRKPEKGHLVPIMTGYKAISEIYKNDQVTGTRDNETDVCFVESVHSIGEWMSAHRIKTIKQLNNSFWDYAPYQEHWYLCRQDIDIQRMEIIPKSLNDYD